MDRHVLRLVAGHDRLPVFDKDGLPLVALDFEPAGDRNGNRFHVLEGDDGELLHIGAAAEAQKVVYAANAAAAVLDAVAEAEEAEHDANADEDFHDANAEGEHDANADEDVLGAEEAEEALPPAPVLDQLLSGWSTFVRGAGYIASAAAVAIQQPRGARFVVYAAAAGAFHLLASLASSPVLMFVSAFVPGVVELAYAVAAAAALLAMVAALYL